MKPFRIAAVGILVVSTAVCVWFGRGVYRHGKAEHNTARLRAFVHVISTQRPRTASAEAIAEALAAAQAPPDLALDAWGRPFRVSIGFDGAGSFHYRVHSLGGDGAPGPCYLPRWPGSEYDADWLIVDGDPVAGPSGRS